jgi:hypothetical protein
MCAVFHFVFVVAVIGLRMRLRVKPAMTKSKKQIADQVRNDERFVILRERAESMCVVFHFVVAVRTKVRRAKPERRFA